MSTLNNLARNTYVRAVFWIAAGIALLLIIQAFGSSTKQQTKQQTDRQLQARFDKAAQQLRQVFYDRDIQTWINQVQGCERTKADRAVNASGWRSAEKARQASYAQTHQTADLVAAQSYDKIASSLESRSGKNLNCLKAFPKPQAPVGVKPASTPHFHHQR